MVMIMGQQMKCLLLIAVIALSRTGSGVHADEYGYPDGSSGLRDNYYRHSCPAAESVIQKTVSSELDKNLRVAGGIIRMQFHDCFVEGCDASVLLDGPDTEKHALVNDKLVGYEIIDAAKSAVEKICPGVVSCADIIAYAARDATVKLNVSSWPVQGGRRDGFHSSALQAEADLPLPEFQVPQLVDTFAKWGLTTEQMVILSGAHTVGVGHCRHIVGRLYDFDEKYFTDPTIDPAYAEKLKQDCPQFTWNNTVNLIMDVITPAQFDSNYYKTLQQNKGLFNSDQSLYLDARTSNIVNSLAQNGQFQTKFGNAMRALAAVGVKTGVQGEIRKSCGAVNY